MTITVFAAELLRLTVDDIGDECLVEIKDPENETDEHIANLRKLVHERGEKHRSRPLDIGELAARLDRLPERESSPTNSYSSWNSLDSEGERAKLWGREEKAYHSLVEDGGRPSHPLSLGLDMIENLEKYGEYQEIVQYWRRGSSGYADYQSQLQQWREFRQHQEWVRKKHIPQWYEEIIAESLADLGCQWDLRVLADHQQQDPLQEWHEFRTFYYRQMKKYKRWVAEASKAFFTVWKEMEDVERGLGGIAPEYGDPPGSNHEDCQQAEGDAEDRVARAEMNLESARSADAEDRCMRIETAERELQAAKDILHLQHRRNCARSHLYRMQGYVERLEPLLKWIDAQYPIIAAECGHPTSQEVDGVSQSPEENSDPKKARRSARLRRGKEATSKSVLGPDKPSRISKRSKNKSGRPSKSQSVDSDPQQPTTAQHQPVETPSPLRRSPRLQLLKERRTDRVPGANALHSVQSARVTKTRRRPNQKGDAATQPVTVKGISETKNHVTNGKRNLRKRR